MGKLGERKGNKYKYYPNFIIGYTSNKNSLFIIDKEDLDKIKEYTWSEDRYGYIYTTINNKIVKLHKFITETDLNVIVDHKNRKKYDNRKSNLRKATQQENNRNHKVRKDNASGVSGVVWMKDNKNWSAVIYINGQTKRCGSYKNIEDAIKARLQAEAKYFGKFAPQKHLFSKYKIEYEESYE